MEKLYCYVDESGQHTQGGIFVVAVVVARKDRDEILAALADIEQSSGKKATKWMKSSLPTRERYLRQVFSRPQLYKRIFYSVSEGSRNYHPITLATVAAAVHSAQQDSEYKASVFIDGLKRREERAVGTGLHRIGVTTEKVRGVVDESSSLIRLADAVAGLAREAGEGRTYAQHLLAQGIRSGNVVLV